MKVIGITGGMASGKSTVARMIAGDRFPHLDADQLVHHLMATDADTIAALAAAFPSAHVNGMISRVELSALIARDPHVIHVLETMLHPRVRRAEERIIAEAKAQGKKAVVLDIPLLFESGAQVLCDVVIAVSAPIALRKERAFARPAMNPMKWDRLIARQLTDEQRNARADVVISTEGTEAETRAQVEPLLNAWGLN